MTHVRRIRAIALGLLLPVTVTCSWLDSVQAPRLAPLDLAFTGDSLLRVGGRVVPPVRVTSAGQVVSSVHLRFASSDTTVVAITPRGDSVVARARGTATVTATALGSELPTDAPFVQRSVQVVVNDVVFAATPDTLRNLGDSLALSANALDVHNAAIPGVPLVYASSDTTVAVVTPTGRVVARRNGSTTVRAMVDMDTATVTVVVKQRLAGVGFDNGSVSLDALDAESTLVATGLDARDHPITGTAFTWLTRDAVVASVDGTGKVRAVTNGATWIVAVSGTVKDSVRLTVAQRARRVTIAPHDATPLTSIGDQLQLTARATDRLSRVVVGRDAAWLTPDDTVIAIDSRGLVVALKVGDGRAIATIDGVADTVVVRVRNDPVVVDVQPAAPTLASVGDTIQLTATVRNGRGVLIAGLPVTWRTPDSTVVSALATGRVIALAAGTARVIGTVDGVPDTSVVTVTNAPASLSIDHVADTVTAVGDSLVPTLTVRNARGAALTRTAVTWSADDQRVVRVTSDGVIVARDTGVTLVRAASGTLRDSLAVTVFNLPTRVVLDATLDTLTAPGQSLTITAEIRNRRGVVLAGVTPAWRSTSDVVASVSSGGVVTARASGTAGIIAEAGTGADTTWVVVFHPTILRVNAGAFVQPQVGTLARPFARIQDAVASANAGDTVWIAASNGNPTAPARLRYPETVVLARRIVLLGDSTAFVAGGRDPAKLPLIAHDSGTMAITAPTTAGITLRYLAIIHTLDGPALDSRGADVDLAWVYVNPGVSSPIGRGIRTARSAGSTALRHVSVQAVREYGIRLDSTTGAIIDSVAVTTPGAVSGLAAGGVVIQGGGGNAIRHSALAGRDGVPAVRVDSSNATVLDSNSLTGWPILVARKSRPLTFRGHQMALQAAMTVGADGRLTVAPALTVDSSSLVWTANVVAVDSATHTIDTTFETKLVSGTATSVIVSGSRFTMQGSGCHVCVTNAPEATDGVELTSSTIRGGYFYVQSGTHLTARGDSLFDTGLNSDSGVAVESSFFRDSYASGGGSSSAYSSTFLGASGVSFGGTNPSVYGNVFDGENGDMSGSAVSLSVQGAAGSGTSAYVTNNRFVNYPKGTALSVSTPYRSSGTSDTAWLSTGTNTFRHVQGAVNLSSDIRAPMEVIMYGDSVSQAETAVNVYSGAGLVTVRGAVIQNSRNGISFGGGGRVTLSGDTVRGADVAIAGGADSLYIESNLVESSRIGIGVYAQGVVNIASNTVRGADSAIVARRWNPGDSLRIEYNTVEGSRLGIIGSSWGGANVSNNTVRGADTAIAMQGYSSYGADSLRVDWNVLDGNGVDVYSGGWSGRFAARYNTLKGARVAAISITGNSSNLEVCNNLIDSATVGIAVHDWYASYGGSGSLCSNSLHHNRTGIRYGPSSSSLALGMGNDFAANDTGLVVDAAAGLSALASGNDFAGNRVGIVNRGSTLEAPWSWWGDGRGPRGADDPAAVGDTLLGAVNFAGWADGPTTGYPWWYSYPALEPRGLVLVRGDLQAGPAGAGLAKALSVRVVDALGIPVTGVEVRFEVTAGGGSLGGETVVTVTTDASGLAEIPLTLGVTPGANTVVATVVAGSVTPLTFTATGN